MSDDANQLPLRDQGDGESAALSPDAVSTLPESTKALLDHIYTRYHETHRRELQELVGLARKVEAVHAEHPDVPHGLADELEAFRLELDEHMYKEEMALFPLMLTRGGAVIGHPIQKMLRDHQQHVTKLIQIEQMARDFVAPDDACRSWRALYAGAAKFVNDLREHIHIENDVLFPRFQGACEA
jgi:regulator of cell morphogenesis and NO signaling